MDFSEIYTRYARDVHRFTAFLSGDPALAEDLTAETFVHALCGPTILRVDTVKAYLLAIARNLYRDSMERQRRLVRIGDVPERADPAPTPERAAADRQTLSTVLKAIQRLPESQREALVLTLDDDLRYDQIGAILGCSVAAVKVRVHRARLQVKSDLETQERTHGKYHP
jgi:RNA polymerase sigma-70 factor, ECF subfamily